MQKGVVTFEDLSEGMMITGKIKNVVDFGAFVDLGIKETALVHISEMGDHFVKDPMEAVKVGDILEFRIIGLDRERKRISLSRKSDAARQAAPPQSLSVAPKAEAKPDGASGNSGAGNGSAAGGGKRRVVAVKAGHPQKAEGAQRPGGERARPGSGGYAGGDHGGGERARPSSGGYAGGDHGGERARPGSGGYGPRRPDRDDDGTMYNPFADALRKMQEGKGKKK
jgi:uncharacterized protein